MNELNKLISARDAFNSSSKNKECLLSQDKLKLHERVFSAINNNIASGSYTANVNLKCFGIFSVDYKHPLIVFIIEYLRNLGYACTLQHRNKDDDTLTIHLVISWSHIK